MRFLCEQCKAKYQIADEKVAGKTVRMKCRKCGHLIEVKAEVTETSVASKAPSPDDDATRVGMDVNSMMQLSKGSGPAATTKPAAPRPGAGATTKPTGLATSLAAAKPAKPAAPPQKESALAGAFQKTVAKEASLQEISTASEWYVAINGVPVGPVRIAELRRKASTGAVTEESLVWQEGMEEWRPLRTIPELVAIVQEGLSAERPSLVSANPPRVTPAPPAPRTNKTPTPAPAPSPFSTPQQRSNVIPLASRLATAEKLEPEPVADPFAMPISVAASAPAPISTDVMPTSGVAAPTVVIPRKQGPNWIVIGMVVAFGAFGATAGVAVFFNKTPPAAAPTVIVTNQVPNPTATTTGGPVAVIDIADPATSGQPGTTRPTGNGGTRPVANAGAGANTQTGGAKPVDPSIAALLGNSTAGPSVGGGTSGGSSGSALSEDAIQRVVQQRSAGVKRTCWERGGGTESNVNVRVKLTIAASGTVQSANAEGNDPIVSKCIENNVRLWQFPASSGPTTVEIPFHFLRQ